jgi:hypothetical protein
MSTSSFAKAAFDVVVAVQEEVVDDFLDKGVRLVQLKVKGADVVDNIRLQTLSAREFRERKHGINYLHLASDGTIGA